MLDGKKVLFISPRFFGYEREIISKLRERNVEVDFVDDRPGNGTLYKALIRFGFGNSAFGRRYIRDYFRKSFQRISSPDYVFVLTPEGFTEENALLLKEQFPKARFVLYMWDSFRNKPEGLKYLRLFDKTLTFDSADAEKYQMNFRPLFFIDDYRKEKVNKYKISFIGTAHSDRYFLIKKILKQLSLPDSDVFTFFYFQSRFLFLYNKLFNPSFEDIRLSDIQYQSLGKAAVVDVVTGSCCVVDVHHPKQIGLTMRTLEVIGARKKLITTNSAIRAYDFFDEANICIIDRDNPKVDSAFLSTPMKNIPDNLYHKYSIDGWIEEIFK
jgi:hypothetical protein